MAHIISHGPLPMVWCRLPDWRVLAMSERFTQLFGYGRAEVQSAEDWFGLAYPDRAYRESVVRIWNGYLDVQAASGTPVPDIEVKVRAKSGSDIHCIISTSVLDRHATVSFYDITSLRTAENRYSLLIGNMTSGFALHQMIYTDDGQPFDFRYLEVNPAFERLMQIPAEVILGHTVRELMPNTEQYWINNYAKVAETGEPMAYMNYNKEIGRWFDTYAFRPRPGLFAVVFNDVTDRVKAENALHDLNADLEKRIAERTAELEQSTRHLMQSEKLAGLGTLVAGVAHEVNTPIGVALTAVSYLSDYLRKTTARDEAFDRRIADGLDITLRNLTRAADIIRAFKQFTADQSSNQSRRFSLADLCQDVATSLSPRLKRCGVEVALSVPGDLWLSGPAGDLSQILTNLIINALEHGFKGEIGEGRIDIAAAMQPQSLEMRIGNDGAAIPREIRNRIFDPFFTTRRGEGGTGLGLSIVHSIVTERCHGRIGFTSGDERGVEFQISLPTGPGMAFTIAAVPE